MLTGVQLPVEGGAVQVASRVWEGGIVMSQRLLPELSATVAPMKFRTRRLLVSVPAAWMLTRASTASLVTIRVTVALSAWEAAVEPPSARTTVQVKPLTAVTLRYSSSMRARNVPEEGTLAVVLTVIDVAELVIAPSRFAPPSFVNCSIRSSDQGSGPPQTGGVGRDRSAQESERAAEVVGGLEHGLLVRAVGCRSGLGATALLRSRRRTEEADLLSRSGSELGPER